MQARTMVGSILLFLSACGGSGGSSDDPASDPTVAAIAGTYSGSTTDSMSVNALLLGDGTYWLFYQNFDSPPSFTSAIQGTITAANESLSSSDAMKFSLYDPKGAFNGTFVGNYLVQTTISGTLSASLGGDNFQANIASDSAAKPSYVLVGHNYTGIRSDITTGRSNPQSISFAIDSASGSFSAIDGGACSITGKATPRSDANAFDLNVTFNAGAGGACPFNGTVHQGIFFYNSATQYAFIGFVSADRSEGWFAEGH